MVVVLRNDCNWKSDQFIPQTNGFREKCFHRFVVWFGLKLFWKTIVWNRTQLKQSTSGHWSQSTVYDWLTFRWQSSDSTQTIGEQLIHTSVEQWMQCRAQHNKYLYFWSKRHTNTNTTIGLRGRLSTDSPLLPYLTTTAIITSLSPQSYHWLIITIVICFHLWLTLISKATIFVWKKWLTFLYCHLILVNLDRGKSW